MSCTQITPLQAGLSSTFPPGRICGRPCSKSFMTSSLPYHSSASMQAWGTTDSIGNTLCFALNRLDECLPQTCRDLMEGKQQHSWESRRDKLFFRGAKTGFRSYIADDLQFMNSSEVDVEFSGWTGDSSKGFHSLPEHCNYRSAFSKTFVLPNTLCYTNVQSCPLSKMHSTSSWGFCQF